MRAHEHPGSEALTTPLLILMAVATGLAAGGNYFNQPLLGTIAESLGTTHAAAAATVTIAQVSYALGLLFLVPLGDMVERLTAGRYRSTPHRVRNETGIGRLSFPLFLDPSWDATVPPLALGEAAGPAPDRWDGGEWKMDRCGQSSWCGAESAGGM